MHPVSEKTIQFNPPNQPQSEVFHRTHSIHPNPNPISSNQSIPRRNNPIHPSKPPKPIQFQSSNPSQRKPIQIFPSKPFKPTQFNPSNPSQEKPIQSIYRIHRKYNFIYPIHPNVHQLNPCIQFIQTNRISSIQSNVKQTHSPNPFKPIQFHPKANESKPSNQPFQTNPISSIQFVSTHTNPIHP